MSSASSSPAACSEFLVFPIALLTNILAGAIFGTALGYIPTYIALSTVNDDCERYQSHSTCLGAEHAHCHWQPLLRAENISDSDTKTANVQLTDTDVEPMLGVKADVLPPVNSTTGGGEAYEANSTPMGEKSTEGEYECVHLFTHTSSIKCSMMLDTNSCTSVGDGDVCVWSAERGCEFLRGFKAWQAGLFGGITMIGGIFGPYLHPLLIFIFRKKITPHAEDVTDSAAPTATIQYMPRFKPVMMTLGTLALIGNVLTTLSRIYDSYPVLLVGRFFSG